MRIPLPTIDFATDEEMKPILPTLSLANSARFGTLFSFAFTRPADAVGALFDKVARPDGTKADDGGAPAGVPVGEQAQRAAQRADWDSVLQSFEQRLCRVAGARARPLEHAALA